MTTATISAPNAGERLVQYLAFIAGQSPRTPATLQIKIPLRAGVCGNIGPREASSPCVKNELHFDSDHQDSSGGTWLW